MACGHLPHILSVDPVGQTILYKRAHDNQQGCLDLSKAPLTPSLIGMSFLGLIIEAQECFKEFRSTMSYLVNQLFTKLFVKQTFDTRLNYAKAGKKQCTTNIYSHYIYKTPSHALWVKLSTRP